MRGKATEGSLKGLDLALSLPCRAPRSVGEFEIECFIINDAMANMLIEGLLTRWPSKFHLHQESSWEWPEFLLIFILGTTSVSTRYNLLQH